MQPNWQSKKSTLNHDWLKHSFLPGIANYLNILSGQIIDEDTERNFVNEVLFNWELRSPEISSLLESFLEEMSPKSLFEYSPLARCSNETKTWLSELVHVRWLNKTKAIGLLTSSRAALQAADAAYNTLRYAIGEGPEWPLTEMQSHFRLIQDFYVRCIELGDTLSCFPRTIEVA
jgi:hypothetical protein